MVKYRTHKKPAKGYWQNTMIQFNPEKKNMDYEKPHKKLVQEKSKDLISEIY